MAEILLFGIPRLFFKIEQSGPAFKTGGNFGHEGGLHGIVAFIMGIILTLPWLRLGKEDRM